MQMRCYRCGWSFALKRDEITYAIQLLEESDDTHYDVRCPRCRHTNKVSLEQLRKFAPRPAMQEESSPEPEPAQPEEAAKEPETEEAETKEE